ncbi:MAG: ATP-binding protein [Prevotella sp.]|nr:ATP-binding protein [Prevotella sp.]
MAVIDIPQRSYAVGVQDFTWIRERNAPYIDKTGYVYKMVSLNATNFFLSRPRRFGKSLLVDVLRCYFEGRKELFEGLAIYDLEKEWRKYPVIRLDLSNGKYFEKELVHGTINAILKQQEEKFGITKPEDPTNYDARLTAMIKAAHEQTSEKVVVLIDEYDAPMLDSIHKPELQDYIRERVRSLFSPLKAQAQYLRLVFLTGISKFSQLSVFSELNNLQQLTFNPEFEAICGITEEEMLTEMKPDIELMMESINKAYARWGIHYTYDEMVAELKRWYDGYHFSENFTDIYCPWSLINAFTEKRIQNYWFSTGTPTSLINILRTKDIDMPELEGYVASIKQFNAPTERITDPVPVLFQSGYLTLKDYNPVDDLWTLGFPNEEVCRGFADCLYQYYCDEYVGSQNRFGEAYRSFARHETTIDDFLHHIQKFFAAMPYDIMRKNEKHYQSILYALLVSINADVSAEGKTATGRMDITLRLKDAIYILELKYSKSSVEALNQVKRKNYAVAFAAESRPVYAVGLNFNPETHTLDDGWKVERIPFLQ